VAAFYALLLGVVQGFTEFLPISSSAHLLLAREIIDWEGSVALGLSFDVACHVGTLLSILVYFRSDVTRLVQVSLRPSAWGDRLRPESVLFRAICWGTVPTIVIGVAAGEFVSGSLRTTAVVAVTLVLGAVAMLVVERIGKQDRDETTLTVWEALAIGCGQALALVPGVSRSGAILVIGLLLGLRRRSAARFAFLLGIPAIFAAGAKTAFDLWVIPAPRLDPLLFAIGIASSAIVGYVVMKYFIAYVSKYSLDVFAAYRFVLGISVAIWFVS
jgi:undecaprenyl-diphosphatase